MRKLFFLTLALLALEGPAFSQKARPINFDLPKPTSDFSSVYHTIRIIDSRTDTNQYGLLSIVNQTLRPVIMQPELQVQLAHYTSPAADSSMVLLLNLRRLEFALNARLTTEDAYCVYKADYYIRSGTGYQRIGSVDTLLRVERQAQYAKKKIMALTGEYIISTLVPYLTNSTPVTEAPLLSFKDIQKTDSIEKIRIPFYAATKLRDGIYQNIQSLYLQQPDDSINTESAKAKYGKLISYEYWDTAKNEWTSPKGFYPFVIVHKGIPFIFHHGKKIDYIQMTRRGQDYYYNGELPGEGYASTMGPTFGLAGYLIGAAVDAASDNSTRLYRLDYISRSVVLVNPNLKAR